MSQGCVALGSQDRLPMNYIWVMDYITDGSQISHMWVKHCYIYESQVNHGMDCTWIVYGCQISHMGHIRVRHWLHFRIHFLFSSPNLPISNSTFKYAYMMERQLVYFSLQCGGTTIDSAE